jgi:hypothetical protein
VRVIESPLKKFEDLLAILVQHVSLQVAQLLVAVLRALLFFEKLVNLFKIILKAGKVG